MLRHGIALLSALVLAATHEVASAQCLGPDGLNGPCWTPVTANLPTFPTQHSTAKGFTVVVPAGVMLTQNFTDLASNISFTPPTMPVFPLVGNVNPTRNLIYVNVP